MEPTDVIATAKPHRRPAPPPRHRAASQGRQTGRGRDDAGPADPAVPGETSWADTALATLRAEAARTCDTHLRVFPLPADWNIQLYLKDESRQPTGSLKHRLARALFRSAIESGDLTAGMTLVEASSGSTAVSEAYFAQMLGLRFVAVMTKSTSAAKRSLIERYGGVCELVDRPTEVYDVAETLGARPGSYYLDQFGRAASVSDWDGEDSIARSVLRQMSLESAPIPRWLVVGAGTGGTSAGVGRYLRAHGVDTKVAVVDPEGSVFTEAWRTGRRDLTGPGSRIEGIGRPRVEPSFTPELIDDMIPVPDAVSLAAADLLRERAIIWAGGSSGTNLAGALALVARMRAERCEGSIVTLVCDGGERYQDTVYNPGWRLDQGIDTGPARQRLTAFLDGNAADPF